MEVDNFIKCKVKANKEMLNDIGIVVDLENKIVEYVNDYNSGYSKIRYNVENISRILGKPHYVYYDIPKVWLEF